MNTKQCENHCPECNSKKITWSDMELGDDVVYQPAICDDCGCEFKEYWKYSDTEISDN